MASLIFMLPVSSSAEDQSWEQVPLELELLIETTPELSDMIEEVLGMHSDTSYWYGYTTDDFVNFFGEWITYHPAPESPALYIEPFDHLVNSDGGELLFNKNVFSSWFIKFLDARGDYLFLSRIRSSSASLAFGYRSAHRGLRNPRWRLHLVQ